MVSSTYLNNLTCQLLACGESVCMEVENSGIFIKIISKISAVTLTEMVETEQAISLHKLVWGRDVD
jgi:hypothetical protein